MLALEHVPESAPTSVATPTPLHKLDTPVELEVFLKATLKSKVGLLANHSQLILLLIRCLESVEKSDFMNGLLQPYPSVLVLVRLIKLFGVEAFRQSQLIQLLEGCFPRLLHFRSPGVSRVGHENFLLYVSKEVKAAFVKHLGEPRCSLGASRAEVHLDEPQVEFVV